MAITNIDKPPSTGTPRLDIGSGYNILIGGIYKLAIGLSGGVFSNNSKASVGETWATINTTWASESRTWLAASQLFSNNSKPSTTISNVLKP